MEPKAQYEQVKFLKVLNPPTGPKSQKRHMKAVKVFFAIQAKTNGHEGRRGVPRLPSALSDQPASAPPPQDLRPDDAERELFWSPMDGEPLTTRQTAIMGRVLQAEMGLDQPPDHATLQAMNEWQFIMGTEPGITPFHSMDWRQWLIRTENELPLKASDTSIEALYFARDQVGKASSLKIETEEEKRALLGDGIVDRAKTIKEWIESFLSHLKIRTQIPPTWPKTQSRDSTFFHNENPSKYFHVLGLSCTTLLGCEFNLCFCRLFC